MTETARPLVTFALFAYNQEKYIREAVEGAFSQTYEPLEIILSDDCSSDRTYEIMQEMATAYDGPHEVRVRRSEVNRGLLGHINEVARDARGAIVIMAAGDDVSLPERAAILTSAFDDVPGLHAAFSDFAPIDSEATSGSGAVFSVGRQRIGLDEIVYNGGGVGKGATYAYRHECFTWPEPLDTALFSEDRLLPMRAAILGRVVYTDSKLVHYRELQTGMGRILSRERRIAVLSREHRKVLRHELNLARSDELLKSWRYAFAISVFHIGYIIYRGKRAEGAAVAKLERRFASLAHRLVTRLFFRRNAC